MILRAGLGSWLQGIVVGFDQAQDPGHNSSRVHEDSGGLLEGPDELFEGLSLETEGHSVHVDFSDPALGDLHRSERTLGQERAGAGAPDHAGANFVGHASMKLIIILKSTRSRPDAPQKKGLTRMRIIFNILLVDAARGHSCFLPPFSPGASRAAPAVFPSTMFSS